MSRIILKIGIIGLQHAYLFSGFINGVDIERFKKYAPNWTIEELEKKGMENLKIFGNKVRVAKVWDRNREEAENLASACQIEEVAEKRGDMLRGIDAVMLLDEKSNLHYEYAQPFLKSKIPVFIDKPFTNSISDARKIVSLFIETNTPVFSSSALRFAREIEELRDKIDETQRIDFALACGPCQRGLFYYGIHTVEMLLSVVKGEIEYVQNIGEGEEKHILKIKYKDGRVVLACPWKGCWRYSLRVYKGSKSLSTEVTDSYYFFRNLLENIIRCFQENKLLVPLEDTLQIIEVLASASQSRQENGKRIYINEQSKL